MRKNQKGEFLSSRVRYIAILSLIHISEPTRP